MSPRGRFTTDVLGERVASLEVETTALIMRSGEHENRLDGHDAWLNQVKGMYRTLVILWGISTAILGLFGIRYVQDLVTKPVTAAIQHHP